jgi:hypothetical protein
LLDDLREGVNLALSKKEKNQFQNGPDATIVADLDPHQSDKLDPDPHRHQFAEDKPKCIEYPGYEPI